MKSLEEFGLVVDAFSVPFFPLNYVSHVEPAFTALSLSAEAVLVEGVPAHEVYGGEGEAVLALRAVVGQERLGCGFDLLELASALLSLSHILLHNLFISLYVELILLQPKFIGMYFLRKKFFTCWYSMFLLFDRMFRTGKGDKFCILLSYCKISGMKCSFLS